MGSTSWTDRDYTARQTHRAATGTTAFTHHAATGGKTLHPDMDVKGKRRESRDSATHPESNALGVVFDVTGSMGEIPIVLQKKLGKLMSVIIAKSLLPDPQILFGAVGDANCDRVPLQIGQFESGLEMDDDLGKFALEGGGGGQGMESYELIPYFFARKVDMDCLIKRGKKGYLFTIGDEVFYPEIDLGQVENLIGDPVPPVDPEKPGRPHLMTKQILAEVLEKFEWFHIVPTTSTSSANSTVARWKDLLNERVLVLDDPDAVCETIVMTVALCEGAHADVHAAATAMASDLDASAVGAATKALIPYSNSSRIAVRASMATSNLPAQTAPAATRL